MVYLYDKETGGALGTISEQQLDFLIGQLEEESKKDDDYYLNQATLDFLKEKGADASLLERLRQALGTKEEVEIRWSRS